jgi:hypothetical protein
MTATLFQSCSYAPEFLDCAAWRTKKGTLAESSTLGVRDTPHTIGNNIKENAAKIAVIPFFTKQKSAFAERPPYALV